MGDQQECQRHSDCGMTNFDCLAAQLRPHQTCALCRRNGQALDAPRADGRRFCTDSRACASAWSRLPDVCAMHPYLCRPEAHAPTSNGPHPEADRG